MTWGKLVGQDEGAIVKVKDVRGASYVAEVSKYVCKGSDLATWEPEHIVQFLTAIKGRRFFFTFGTLFAFGREVRRTLNGPSVRRMRMRLHQIRLARRTQPDPRRYQTGFQRDR